MASMQALYRSYTGIPLTSWIRILARCMNDMSAGIVFFLMYYFTQVLHLSIPTSAFILSCYGFGTIFSSLFSGRLTHLFSANTVSIVLMLIKSVNLCVFVHLTHVSTLMCSAFVLGAMDYGFIVPNMTWLINRNTQKNRLNILSALSVFSNLGMAIALMLSSVLVATLSYVFYLMAFLSFVVALVLVLSDRQYEQHEEVVPSDNHYMFKKHSGLLIWILCCACSIGMMFSFGKSVGIVYLHAAFTSISLRWISFVLLLNLLLVVLFQQWVTQAVQGMKKIHLVSMGVLLVGLGMSLFYFTLSFAIPLIACVVYTVGEMLFIPSAQLMCHELGK